MAENEEGRSTPIKQDSRDTPYRGQRSTEPEGVPHYINESNNNQEASTPGAAEPNVKSKNSTGIGDEAVNNSKLTDYTSNHSADA